MSSEIIDDYGSDFDPKVLARLLFLFNIARRQVTTYPDEHPLIAHALHNFLAQLDTLLEFSNEVTLGIARDTILIGNSSLEKNAVFTDLAQTLFDCDIAAITMHRSAPSRSFAHFSAYLVNPLPIFGLSVALASCSENRGCRGSACLILIIRPFMLPSSM